jgi:Rps23 Pro-64 3,4-dihydroxylase Tpa1-like proline 4-hydroxylase
MKLIYNIEDKFFWIHNFLPNHEYERIHNAIFKENKKIKYEDSSKTWETKLINNLTSPNRIDINSSYFYFYKTLLFHQPFIKLNSKNINFMIYKMHKNSGINWHSDSHVDYGVTYYINKRWNSNWGGEFMFKHNNNYGYLPVVGNSLVIIKTPMHHKVNPVLSSIIPRFTIQSFIN